MGMTTKISKTSLYCLWACISRFEVYTHTGPWLHSYYNLCAWL